MRSLLLLAVLAGCSTPYECDLVELDLQSPGITAAITAEDGPLHIAPDARATLACVACDRRFLLDRDLVVIDSEEIPAEPKREPMVLASAHATAAGITYVINQDYRGIDPVSTPPLGTLVAYEASTELWRVELGRESEQYVLTAGPEGPYVAIRSAFGLRAFATDGSVRWTKPAGTFATPDGKGSAYLYQPARAPNGTAIATLSKVDTAGNALWMKSLTANPPMTPSVSFHEVVPTATGVLVIGEHGGSLAVDANMLPASNELFAMQLDDAGAITWLAALGTSSFINGVAIAGEDVIVGGRFGGFVGPAPFGIRASTSTQTTDGYLVRFDRNGVKSTRVFAGIDNQSVENVVVIDGDIFVELTSYSNGFDEVIKTSLEIDSMTVDTGHKAYVLAVSL